MKSILHGRFAIGSTACWKASAGRGKRLPRFREQALSYPDDDSELRKELFHFFPDLREGADRRGRSGMLSHQLFQPDHVVPAAKFITAAGERADRPEAQMGVKPQTVPGQVFILLHWKKN